MTNPNQSNAKSLAELRAQKKKAEAKAKAQAKKDGQAIRKQINKAKKKKG